MQHAPHHTGVCRAAAPPHGRSRRSRCRAAAADDATPPHQPRSLYGASPGFDPGFEKLDGGCGEPLFYGGRESESSFAARARANRPGGNPELPTDRALSALEALYSGAATRDARPPRPARAVAAGRVACAACGCTGFVACATCGCSGVYVEPCTQSAGVTNLVPCVSCGGSGDTLCDACAGRGALQAA